MTLRSDDTVERGVLTEGETGCTWDQFLWHGITHGQVTLCLGSPAEQVQPLNTPLKGCLYFKKLFVFV